MPYPSNFGQPCWEEHQVEKLLGVSAKMSDQSADGFLAAHSPFRLVRNARVPDGRELSEEDVFKLIFGRHGEVQAAIKGEPGTGKSHFVHWLKLRLDFQAEGGDLRSQKFVRVLVQRGNGSLKNTLRQIIEKLGEGFREHLRQLQGAIDKMSAENASATLLSDLGLEISPRWKERPNRPPFPKNLKQLAPALRSEGVQRWLLRQGGVIDQMVNRLTSGSAPSEQDSWPEFTSDELSPPASYLSLAETSEDVRDFFLTDLAMEPELRRQAADMLNIARADAIAALTGLSGTGLREIFDNIRRDLRLQGRDLALFIEDVSVTGFDREVINALEPQERDDLCRMVAVIGITSNAWTPLEENQKGRFDPVFEVGAQVTERWSSSPEEVAQFTARYLNAIRCTDREISTIAETRREQTGARDVPGSKCDACPHREPCHRTFGRITLPNDVHIGLFPFTPRAPQALLAGLSEDTERTGVRRSQRGLIENILIPVLQSSRDALEQEQFPQPSSLPVRMTRQGYWLGFTHTYLGGAWNATDKDRAQLLAEYWIDGGDAESVATQLQPLLAPLGLPSFERMPATSAAPVTNPRPDEPTPTSFSHASPELLRKLQALENWLRGGPLRGDGEIRKWLGDFFSRSIPWPDVRTLPIAESARLINTNFPRIEGQERNPIGQARFHDLPRNQETRDLLEALAQFNHAGKSTWNFEHGELHKRVVWRWLRGHRDEVIGTLQPEAPVSAPEAVKTATQALALSAILRDRKQLPKDAEGRLERLFSKVWSEEIRPSTLGPAMKQFIDHLERRHSELCDFLIAELGAGQGESAPKDYLDPTPILDALRDPGGLFALSALSPEFHQGFCQKRFASLRGLADFVNLPERLQAERSKTAEIVEMLRSLLIECGADLSEDLRTGFGTWLGEFVDLVEIQRGSRIRRYQLDVPNPSFNSVWEERIFQTQPQRDKLAATLSEAAALAANENENSKWLTFDPQPLLRLHEVVIEAKMHLAKIDKLATQMEEHLTGSGGGERDALINQLNALASLPLETPSQTATIYDDESA